MTHDTYTSLTKRALRMASLHRLVRAGMCLCRCGVDRGGCARLRVHRHCIAKCYRACSLPPRWSLFSQRELRECARGRGKEREGTRSLPLAQRMCLVIVDHSCESGHKRAWKWVRLAYSAVSINFLCLLRRVGFPRCTFEFVSTHLTEKGNHKERLALPQICATEERSENAT